MKLEPKLALQATLYLLLFLGYIGLLFVLPLWVVVLISLSLGWGMIYSALYMLQKFKKQ